MRIFEIILIISLALQVSRPLLPAPWRNHTPFQQLFKNLPFLSFFLSVIQIIVEGYRWQMLPAFLLTILLVLLVFREQKPHRLTWLATIVGLLWVAVAAILPAIIPIPKLAPLTGTFSVGTASFHLVDENRIDPYASQANQPREVMMQIWYPVDPDSTGESVQFIDNLDIVSEAIAAQFDIPAFLLDHLDLANPHAMKNMPLANNGGTFPVLLFSHGLGGIRAQNTYQVEQLASHGYIVAAVDHTFAAAVTVFPEDRVVFYRNDLMDFSTPESTYQTSNVLVTTWVGDLTLMLDTLTEWDEADPRKLLTGRLDLSRVGVFGHSTGGGATVEFCARDSRCQAALLLDPWLEPVTNEIFEGALTQPAMIMEESAVYFTYLSHAARTQWVLDEAAVGYHLEIEETRHFDFTDVPLVSPLTDLLDLTGDIAPARMHTIVNAYTIAFFNHTLFGIPSPLLDAPSSEYPEVIFQN